MVKTKTLQKQKKSLENTPKFKIKEDALIEAFSPTEELLDENFIGKAIVECLKNNDPEGVIEVLNIYLNTINRAKAAQEAHLPRSTFYHSLKTKNPTIKTLAKLVYASTLSLKR